MDFEKAMWSLMTLLVVAPMVGYMGWVRKKDKEKLDKVAEDNISLMKDVEHLQTAMLTEDNVRAIVHDNLEPVKEGQTEIKNTVNTIHDTLTEMRIQMASNGNGGQTDHNNS